MLLDEFLSATATRVPAVNEMIGLCDALGITFVLDDGKPSMKPNGAKREAELLAKLFRREPFRSRVIAAKLQPAEPPKEVPVKETTIPDGDGVVWWMFGSEDKPVLVSDYELQRMCAAIQRHNDSIKPPVEQANKEPQPPTPRLFE